MSTHFNGYQFPKRDLWRVVDAARSYLAADHRYALVAQLAEIAHFRRIVRLGSEHAETCATRYLGQCTCDWWTIRDQVKKWIAGDTSRDFNGLEGQCVEYGRSYIMRITGDYWWQDTLPDELCEHLGVKRIYYNDSTDVPDEDKPNRIVVERFDKAFWKHNYCLVPLLTLDDIDHIQWNMAMFLGRRAHLIREGKPAAA